MAATPRHPYIEKIKDFYQNYKETKHISIPLVLQDIFEIYKNFNDDFVVYPANILMFDFGGEEKSILFLRYDSGKEEKYRCQKNQCDREYLN